MKEDTIPLEAGIEDRAISTSKGCYVGQEVIIRVLHRGHGRVAKHLVGLAIDGPAPAAGAPIASGDREVGRVTSAAVSPRAGTVALGYVHRDFAAPGTELSVGDGQRPAREFAPSAVSLSGAREPARMTHMSGTDGPKSFVELAMERLRKKDEAAGVERQALTDEQKAQIAEVRNLYGAKLAQAEVLHQGALDRTFDPAERATLEEQYRRERESPDVRARVEGREGTPWLEAVETAPVCRRFLRWPAALAYPKPRQADDFLVDTPGMCP